MGASPWFDLGPYCLCWQRCMLPKTETNLVVRTFLFGRVAAMLSHRSGMTADTTIATNASQKIAVGSPRMTIAQQGATRRKTGRDPMAAGRALGASEGSERS